MSDLSPCPFCGAEAFLCEDENGEFGPGHVDIRCGGSQNCRTNREYFSSEEHAIEVWNTRAAAPPVMKEEGR